MKTTIEEFIEVIEAGTKTPFPKELKIEWRQMELDKIREAWVNGYETSEISWSSSPDKYMERYNGKEK